MLVHKLSWVRSKTKSLTSKSLLSINIVLLLPLILGAVLIVNNYIENSILKFQHKLALAASELDTHIYPLLDELSHIENSQELSLDDKILLSSQLLQPAMESISASSPEISIGFHHLNYDSIIATTPNFSVDSQVDANKLIYGNFLQSKVRFILENSPATIFVGESMIRLEHPIFDGKTLIGHTWASMKMQDIYYTALIMIANTFVLGLALWFVVLFLIRRVVRKMQHSLYTFSSSIIDNKIDPNEFTDFPELEPVLSKIKHHAYELKLINENLNQVNSFLTNIMEGIDEGFFTLDNEFRFTYVNRKHVEWTGRERNSLLGKNLLDVYPEALSNNTYDQLHKAMTTKQSTHWEVLWNDGCWYELHAHPFTDGISVFTRDVTSEKALEENTFELASIVDNANIAIIGRTVDGIITSWNPGAEKLFGYEPHEVIGKPIFTIVSSEAKAITTEAIESSQKGMPMPVFESVGIRKDGTKIHLSIALSLVRNQSGKVTRVSAIISDITSIKRSQKEFARLDRLNLIGQMAAGISHEVRNPLTTVRGFLQMLSIKDDLERYRDYFSLMISELDRANSIITEFLSLSKDRPINLEKGNINELISKIFPIIQADAFNSGKDIALELAEVSEILMDKNEVRQLILNLIRNALEVTPEGAKAVIKTREHEDKVILEVIDYGSGIPPEVLEKLGTPFITTKDNGTGIGLSICYGIAESHQAKINVQTGPNGTTFKISFPKPLINT